MFHTLWGKAQGHPDYDKKEWLFLQQQFDGLLLAAQAAYDNYRSYLGSGEGPRSFIPSMDRLGEAITAAKKERP